jgi:hypothetical protein
MILTKSGNYIRFKEVMKMAEIKLTHQFGKRECKKQLKKEARFNKKDEPCFLFSVTSLKA